jgi:hypothetical protein
MTGAAARACCGESPPPARSGADTGSPARTCANRKILAANRANAARSTGPRTAAGKAAVARNALRHGLSLPVLADPALAPEVAALATRIAGEGAGAARHAAAVRIAEAQVDVSRVRRLRDRIIASPGAGIQPGHEVAGYTLGVDCQISKPVRESFGKSRLRGEPHVRSNDVVSVGRRRERDVRRLRDRNPHHKEHWRDGPAAGRRDCARERSDRHRATE